MSASACSQPAVAVPSAVMCSVSASSSPVAITMSPSAADPLARVDEMVWPFQPLKLPSYGETG